MERTEVTTGAVLQARDFGCDTAVDCDVVVIGSGAGGATTAAVLAEAGVDVVVLEEGPYRETSTFNTSMGASLRNLYRDSGASIALGRPPVMFSEGRCIGGSTVVNGGMCFRPPERVTEAWDREHDVAVTDLEPLFRRAELALHVNRQDPETIGTDAKLFQTGAQRLGWSVIENTRNQVHCAGSNNCAFGCPTGAKQSMLVSAIPSVLAHGGRVVADCRVDQILRRGKRAVGVEATIHGPGAPPRRLTVRSAVVVVAAGSVQTPALIHRSGFRSPSGQLGRNLTLHPNAKVIGVFDHDVLGWQGVHQAFQVREFIDQGILLAAANLPPALVAMGLPQIGDDLAEAMQDYNRMVVMGCLVEDSTSGRVIPGRSGPTVVYRPAAHDLRNVVRGVGLSAELLFAAGAQRVILPFRGFCNLLSADEVRGLFRRQIPRSAFDLFTVHLMGTARMSDDRTRGVVSSHGVFNDAFGLLVSDASLFPTPSAVNPMLTIVALAMRNADALLADRSRYGF